MKRKSLIICLVLALLLTQTGCSSLFGASSGAGLSSAAGEQSATAETRVQEPVMVTTPPEPANTVILLRSETLGREYCLTALNPWAQYLGEKRVINAQGAEALIRWLLTQEARDLVDEEEGSVFRSSSEIPAYSGWISPAQNSTKNIRLLVDTELAETGMLEDLLLEFYLEYGYEVELIVKAPEEIYLNAPLGEGDLILAQTPTEAELLLSGSYYRQIPGLSELHLACFRCPYVLCGPSEDPASVADCGDMESAFAAIRKQQCCFISRGDGSDLHRAEEALWGNPPEGDWYFAVDGDMGPCLVIAEEMGGYVLADELTYSLFAGENGIIG